ncbi:MAG: NACHT domain-containing protein [Thiotrichales bacterium]
MSAAAYAIHDLRVFISYPRGGFGHTWAERVQRDLEQRGADAFRDESSIDEGEQDWEQRIALALDRADVVVCVVCRDSAESKWVKREMLRADAQSKVVVPLRVEAVPVPFVHQEKQPVEHRGNDADTLQRLAEALLREWKKSLGQAATSTAGTSVAAVLSSLQRERESTWLQDLVYCRFAEHREVYTALEGREVRSRSLGRTLRSVPIHTHVMLKCFGKTQEPQAVPDDPVTYGDALDAYRALATRKARRLVVLGEPGAGKSYSLQRIALDYAERALADPQAPVPVLVELGAWTREAEALEPFIERSLGPLGRHFPALRNARRVMLLLDAINEIPPGQRRMKAKQIEHLARDERFVSVVTSCREKDFRDHFQLPFDTLTLQPLAPEPHPGLPASGVQPPLRARCQRGGGRVLLADRGGRRSPRCRRRLGISRCRL